MGDMSVMLGMSRNPGQQTKRRSRRDNNPNTKVRPHGVVVHHMVPIDDDDNRSA